MKHEPNGMLAVDRLLREHGMVAPDEVWVHGMWTADKWLRCVKAKMLGKKLVRMTHGSLSPVYLEQRGKWKKRLVKPIEKILFAISDRVIATGVWEVEWARSWGYRGRIEVIDLKQFFDLDCETNHCPSPRSSASLHVLYLGRRHPLKGIQYLERAIATVSASQSHSLVLRIASDHFGEELERDWEWCDVLCLPTLSENFGLVVAEALERGKRVITTDGAPAWDGESFGGRLVYLRGYREGTEADRVRLLKEALLKCFKEHYPSP